MEIEDGQSGTKADRESIRTEPEALEKDIAAEAEDYNVFPGYESFEKGHKVLTYDICSAPKYDYENTPMAEYIEEAIENYERISQKEGRPASLEIDYHLFDFNDDGVEDYLLCMCGAQHIGKGGNRVDIYIQEKEGARRVCSALMELHIDSYDHEKLMILDEKSDGYYTIVTPYSNHILKYDSDLEMYDWADVPESIPEAEDGRNGSETSAGTREQETEVKQKSRLVDTDGDTVRNVNYFVNFEDLAEHHKVLDNDLCSISRDDYENTPLKEYIESVLFLNRKRSKEVGRPIPLEIDYHLFDFNDDGIEDYLLCIYEELKNDVGIFIQEGEGIRRVLDIDMSLHYGRSDHVGFTVLDEKTSGYYAIVLPSGNFILRYDVGQEKYDFNVKD